MFFPHKPRCLGPAWLLHEYANETSPYEYANEVNGCGLINIAWRWEQSHAHRCGVLINHSLKAGSSGLETPENPFLFFGILVLGAKSLRSHQKLRGSWLSLEGRSF